MTRTARMLWLVVPAALGLYLAAAPAQLAQPAAPPERTVFLVGDLPEEDVITFTANLAASGHPGVLLLDAPQFARYAKTFFEALPVERVVPVGSFNEKKEALARRLGVAADDPVQWQRGERGALWSQLFAKAPTVVVCPAEPRRLLLQAACLAGALRAPLFVTRGEVGETAELRRLTGRWQTSRVYAVGGCPVARKLPEVKVSHLPDEAAVAALCLKTLTAELPGKGSVPALVVANPADSQQALGTMSLLAPWLATQKRAPLLLTDEAGANTAALVHEALKHPKLRETDALILLASLEAIPVEKRPNPVPGKDKEIEMEPLTPQGSDVYSFATGRLFHADPGVVTLMLARQRLLTAERWQGKKPKALVVSNPSGGLPLLETFSRMTARTLETHGYETKAIFGDDVSCDEVRRLLPQHDIFLWEGHHSTLVKEYQLPQWTEPLPPSFIFLQSCLALMDAKAHPLLERGGVAVVGSSTRIYSATGGAFSLAYFNDLLHHGDSLGGSLRYAKNFLVTYARLKENRLGQDAKLTGANLRSAWAFTLWGDPTLKLPRPEPGRDHEAYHEVRGGSIVLQLEAEDEKVASGKYQAPVRSNGHLAGLLKMGEGEARELLPFVFAEVRLPKAPPGMAPKLRGKLPSTHWAFTWDPRRKVGYLLVTPRSQDRHEVRFPVEWEPESPRVAVWSKFEEE